VNCSVCQDETSPVKIGGLIYCSVCGTPATLTGPAPKRLSLDLTPRSRTNAGASKPPAHAAGHAVSASAAALHSRVKPSQILDLRHTPAPAHKTTPIVQTPHHEPAAPPKSTAHERHLAHASDRIEQAKQIGKSPLVNKFGGERLAPHAAHSPHQTDIPAAHEPVHEPAPELPQQAATHHEAMAALPKAPDTSSTWRPHLDLSPNRGRMAATVAAVLIMAGYIWVQNYPKLALQSASSKAGVSATLPGYLPSSYSLARTDTSPGLVTLNFSSPSASEPLKIAQARTSWDSTSLLDNFVAKNADDYSTVQGQGLTVYMFGQNRATWVNKGIWFSIEGTGRLSREQILKMAYSL